jgi:hypothetical protein
MKAVFKINKCGPTMRINGTKLISYSWHNFNTPLGKDHATYQKQRWERFVKLCCKHITNFAIIKNDKCVFLKGKV